MIINSLRAEIAITGCPIRIRTLGRHFFSLSQQIFETCGLVKTREKGRRDMRQLTVKYAGECKKCGNDLDVGQSAMYEKSMGIFCVGCGPNDVEEIRAFRLMKAEKKAERYEEWAQKRVVKAKAQLNSMPEVRHDWAFITQPGRIPMRARMNAADDRAYESLKKAGEMRAKASSLRHVVVAGDAERKRQALRDFLDSQILKGSRVHDAVFGDGEVVQVCKKSYRVKYDRLDKVIARDKTFVRPIRWKED